MRIFWRILVHLFQPILDVFKRLKFRDIVDHDDAICLSVICARDSEALWPAVSQICSLTVLSPILIVRNRYGDVRMLECQFSSYIFFLRGMGGGGGGTVSLCLCIVIMDTHKVDANSADVAPVNASSANLTAGWDFPTPNLQ